MILHDPPSQFIMKAPAMRRSILLHSAPAPLSAGRILRSLWYRLQLRQTRQRLADLDAHMLADIGLTEAQARREAARPLWDAPASWRQAD